MTATTVTMPVEELAKLVKHADNQIFVYNLMRQGPQQYHRCVEIRVIDHIPDGDPEVRFELREDAYVKRTVALKLSDIFELLPRLKAWLAEQVDA